MNEQHWSTAYFMLLGAVLLLAILSTTGCTWIEIAGKGHTVNTTAEVHTGSANDVDAEVDP